MCVCVCVLMHACLRMYGGMYPHAMGYVSVYVCECVHESNLVFYTQSTIMFISGQGKREKLGCFTPSQSVWLYQGDRDRNIQINYIYNE